MSEPSCKSPTSYLSSMSKGFQPMFTLKLIQSSQHDQSSQSEPEAQNNYKAEYKKMKAKLALLEASPPTSQFSKPFQSKNKGLVLIALADDELFVGNNYSRNGEWIDITMKKLTESSSKNDAKDNPFVLASLYYDHEMVPKSKDKVERLNLDSKCWNLKDFKDS
ncbi:hypothetical protein Tco_0006491 [Tanacetum coccineum]